MGRRRGNRAFPGPRLCSRMEPQKGGAMLTPIQHGPILELRLARPPANALNPGLIAALRDAVAAAPAQGARALVLSGADGMFSAGLDVPELLPLDRPALR